MPKLIYHPHLYSPNSFPVNQPANEATIQHLAFQPTNQLASQLTNCSATNQSNSQPTTQPTSHAVKQLTSQPVGQLNNIKYLSCSTSLAHSN
jgi:hypothetical protein